jgi:uncharacterized protein
MSDRPRIVIAGGSGFVGRALLEELAGNYETVVLSRSSKPVDGADRVAVWDAKTVGPWREEFEGARAVVNLVGETLMQKWDAETKRRIIASRVLSAHAVGEAIAACGRPPEVWVNGSAVGFYGSRGAEPLDETSSKGTGFLAETCDAWERAAEEMPTEHTRKVLLRIGIVLGPDGGALATWVKLAKFYLGGQIGDGSTYIPWIHQEDLARMIRHAVERPVPKVVNGVSPEPASNAEFMKVLRDVMGRPWSPPAPAFVVRAFGKLFGPDPEAIFTSTRVYPRSATESGFVFRHPTLGVALRDLLQIERA